MLPFFFHMKKGIRASAVAISITTLATMGLLSLAPKEKKWQSKLVQQREDGSLHYTPDSQGNILPDFSRVGYCQGNKTIPDVPVVKTVHPSANSEQEIQAAIDALSAQPADANGCRGAILLTRGTYAIAGTLTIKAGGIVLRGEGDTPEGTKLVATGRVQRSLISVSGAGDIKETGGTRVAITDRYVPVGAFSFHVTDASGFKPGDAVVLFRPGTAKWIQDLQMDKIADREGVKQWQPAEYDLSFERVITRIEGNTVYIDNPVVLALETAYGGGALFKYTFSGRLQQTGIENLYCESAFASDTAEDHGWDAIHFNKIANSWVRHVTARYFGYSCVNLASGCMYITVDQCQCLDAKSQIIGGRRYSFTNDGQLNLFMHCHTTEGRHDYVTGAKVCGPNVFYNCTATQEHADIGPHHRWAVGTLFDNIVTDGEINVQDRGNWGTGHGWAGVNQVIWHCTAPKATIQNPWVNGTNYCIGLQGQAAPGRLQGRNNGYWEGQNQSGLEPASLYMAQLRARGARLPDE